MIVTFGSINADLVFSIKEMPQPGQTLLADQFRTEAGGKGANQAVAASRDGANVVMVGAVGKDALADVALKNLVEAVDLSRVSRATEPTGCASILIDSHGRNMIAVASGANLVASSDDVDDALIHNARIVLMQMENDPVQIEKLIRRLSLTNAMSILNLAPAFPLEKEILSLCDLIVVNEDEAEALAGWLTAGSSATDLSRALGTGVLKTLGGDGAEASVAGEIIKIPAFSVEVKDTTAAGDCFVGVLASALDRGLPLKDAMKRAATAAGLACSRSGSQSSIPFAMETDQCLENPE
ncbi:ribose-phosphate pyrophosphokinase [Pararhizobium polonicum]|uniref:Ribokinase n=1 Tax=Pararhizobium polonicum TaxID=1612624 RepID=A0A1C7NT62_9HYPH|nr:ribokinase [Pararhizobium polonicum]OBZ92173.1 ribose-phosphate pyrophosphokinase [Pararhizobium polonicum]